LNAKCDTSPICRKVYKNSFNMRKINITRILIFTVFILFAAACKKDNISPTAEVVAPADGETFFLGDQVDIQLAASDEDGSVVLLSLYIEGEAMESSEGSSLDYSWDTGGLDLGEYEISAVAKDDQGEYSSDYVMVVLDVPGGFNPDLTYGTVTDVDGNSYATIQIGDQVWMAENLKATHYADGAPIPEVSSADEWVALTPDPDLKAYCWYDNIAASGDTAGALYNWAAAVKGEAGSDLVPSGIQGVCPDGWHLPSDGEWKELEMFLGMNQTDADKTEWRGSSEGGDLKEAGFSGWSIPNTGGSNASGFTAIPGGFRSNSGSFYSFHQYASYWTATGALSDDEMAWYRTLYYNNEQVYRQYKIRTQGFSVRCVKDL